MKEKIRKICTQLNDGQIAVSQATEQLLLLFSVIGNEANPSDNKKDGEVAVAFAEWIDKNNFNKAYYDKWVSTDSNWAFIEYTIEQLFEQFKDKNTNLWTGKSN